MQFLLWIYFIPFFATGGGDKWISLLDGDLSQWDVYLSYRHVPGYNGQVPKNSAGLPMEPIGWNPDGQTVFTMKEESGEPVLKVSGEVYGCVISKQSYRNYHLKLKVKWGEKKWSPRESLLRDTGILYHSQGEPGVDYWRSWMLSQEFQIMEGHMGDFWGIANSAIDIRAYLPEGDMNPVADESQPFLSFGAGEEINSFCLRDDNHELSAGQWNELELICYEGKSIHIVNGHVVMILQNSRYAVDGKKMPLTEGKIQLQSEAAEAYFKEVKIRQLASLPKEYSRFFN